MVRMKCKLCGAAWTVDDSFSSMEIRCPDCGERCKSEHTEETSGAILKCSECGLICPAESGVCPACGGSVVAVLGDQATSENAPSTPAQNDVSKQNDVSDPYWDNFAWGFVFPVWLFLVGVLSLFISKGSPKNKIGSLGFVWGSLIGILTWGIVFYMLLLGFGRETS